jgi:hypothetical protein
MRKIDMSAFTERSAIKNPDLYRGIVRDLTCSPKIIQYLSARWVEGHHARPVLWALFPPPWLIF